MKFIIFLEIIFLLLISGANGKSSKNNIKLFSKAISDVLNEVYIKKLLNFDYFIYDESRDRNCQYFALNIIETIRKVMKNLPPSKIKIMNENKNSIQFERSNIIFLCSHEDIKKVNQKIKTVNINHVDFTHFVVMKRKSSESDINKAFNNDANFYYSQIIHYQIFLYQKESELKLSTYNSFAQSNCKVYLNSINSFSFNNESWKNRNFSLSKLKQFNGCDLKIRKNDKLYSNKMITLYKELSVKLNYTIEVINTENVFVHISSSQVSDIVYSKGSIFRYGFFDQEIVLLIHDGVEYTAYEKFLLPFDVPTWILSGLFFGGAFLIILIVKFTRNKNIQNIVFGKRVTSPAFNVLVAFFGQSQSILPSHNFARYILMLFIIFCLIIRTGYQGVQFELMYKVS